MLRDRLGVSERWACRVIGQHRSTQRREPTPAADDEALRGELRAFSNQYERGIKISDADLATVNLHRDDFHGEWNYRVKPRRC